MESTAFLRGIMGTRCSYYPLLESSLAISLPPEATGTNNVPDVLPR